MKDWKKEIRTICTTLKRNGSGYFNLNEEQFEKLEQLFDQEIKKAKYEEKRTLYNRLWGLTQRSDDAISGASAILKEIGKIYDELKEENV